MACQGRFLYLFQLLLGSSCNFLSLRCSDICDHNSLSHCEQSERNNPPTFVFWGCLLHRTQTPRTSVGSGFLKCHEPMKKAPLDSGGGLYIMDTILDSLTLLLVAVVPRFTVVMAVDTVGERLFVDRTPGQLLSFSKRKLGRS